MCLIGSGPMQNLDTKGKQAIERQESTCHAQKTLSTATKAMRLHPSLFASRVCREKGGRYRIIQYPPPMEETRERPASSLQVSLTSLLLSFDPLKEISQIVLIIMRQISMY